MVIHRSQSGPRLIKKEDNKLALDHPFLCSLCFLCQDRRFVTLSCMIALGVKALVCAESVRVRIRGTVRTSGRLNQHALETLGHLFAG